MKSRLFYLRVAIIEYDSPRCYLLIQNTNWSILGIIFKGMEKENIPKVNETIAARRSARLAEKFRQASMGINVINAWWTSGLVEVLLLGLILILNFYSIYSYFGTASSDAFFSGPVVPLMAKLVGLFGFPLTYSIQIVNIFFFLALPLSLYVFIKFVTERKLIALLASLFISLPLYPFAQLRVVAAMIGSDSAHIASLSMIPIALYGLALFIRKGGVRNLIVASISSALVALISPFGFMTYIIFAFIFTFSEVLLGSGRLKFFRFLTAFFFAGGLNSFWYNPGFFIWMITGPLGEDVRYMISKLIPLSFFILPVLGAFGYLLFDRRPKLQSVFLALFYTLSFGTITLAGGGIFPSHPSRYMAELGISLSLLLSIGIVKLVDFLKFTPIINKLPAKGIVPNLILFLFVTVIVGMIVFGQNRLLIENENVLGIWEGVEKGDIWRAKENFKGVSSLSGYVISAFSFFGLSIIALKSRLTKYKNLENRGENVH
jgi:hypothetical protein